MLAHGRLAFFCHIESSNRRAKRSSSRCHPSRQSCQPHRRPRWTRRACNKMLKRKRKTGGNSSGRKSKGPRGPELPRALVKEIGYDVLAPRNAKAMQAQDKKTTKPTRPAQSTTKIQQDRVQSKRNDSSPDSIEAELQMQAMLAKKLKLKKGQSRTGPDDGLDGLLEGFEDLVGAKSELKPVLSQQWMEEEDANSDDPGFADPGALDTDDEVESDDATNDSSHSLATEDSGDDLLRASGTSDDQGTEDSQDAEPSPFKAAPGATHGGQDVDHRPAHDKSADMPAAAAQGERRASATDEDGQGDAGSPPGTDAQPPGKKYIPPALRGSKLSHTSETQTPIDPEQAVVKRQVRSLLNRVAAANMAGIASEIAGLFGRVPRHFLIQTIVQSFMQALEEGPRAADQFAAVMSCLIVMVSAMSNVQELLAKVMLALADGLENSRCASDSIAASNTARVICCLYSCKGIGSKVMYSLLEHLKEAFSDGDVHLILLVLNTVGFQLRGDDAAGMKTFIESVHAKSASKKASGDLSQRARLMLELIVDIKNNRKRKIGGVHAGLDASLPPATLKQLRECNADLIALHHVTWEQLCASDHRGAWWLPQAAVLPPHGGDVERPLPAVAAHPESSALLQLASKQRMNTDSRRAIFCVLMSAEDHMDAVERLIRLPLKGTADRDIAHVLLHCCMQEAGWNPFYAHVAARLLAHSKTYRNSIQYAVQDRLRRIAELNARQATNLASFMAHLLAQQGLPLTMFKVVELDKVSKRSILFCRFCLQRLLQAPQSQEDVYMVFSKLQNADVRAKLLRFLQRDMGPWLAGLKRNDEQGALLLRVETAETALKSARVT
eukprot:jgi/Ulvmu1/1530/UM011_0260.1